MAKPPEIYQDERGEWRFRVKGRNGEIVATGEGHGSPGDAERALSGLRRILRDTNGDLPIRISPAGDGQ